VNGFPGGTYKKFINAAEAESFARGSESATIAETISHVQTNKRELSLDAEDGRKMGRRLL